MGSGACFEHIAPHFDIRVAGDGHEDLILMWQALASGWIPPESITREEYQRLKGDSPSALRGFVGFGASFGGKWFGGFADTPFDKHHNRHTLPFIEAARRSVLKTTKSFHGAQILHSDYWSHEVDSNTVIYCDPPYADTVGYKGALPFSSAEFWAVAEVWVNEGARVVVSEEKAPSHWRIVAFRDRKASLRVSVGEENLVRRENLYTLP